MNSKFLQRKIKRKSQIIFANTLKASIPPLNVFACFFRVNLKSRKFEKTRIFINEIFSYFSANKVPDSSKKPNQKDQ